MKDEIKSLLTIQERDLELDRFHAELAAIPTKISAIKNEIQGNKTALEEAKKDLNQHQLSKKQRELDLESQEAAVRKHSGELNAVKTNEAYKALLGEIQKAKDTQSALEDQILQLMEQIDQAMKVWKEKETISKGTEAGLLKQISDWEAKGKEIEQTLAAKQADRDLALGALPKTLSAQYEKLRSGKRGAALAPIRKEQCTGCHMKISQATINEVRRGMKIMTCESCSRIVYLEEVPAAQ